MGEEEKGTQETMNVNRKIHNSEEFGHYVHAVSIPMKVAMAAIVVFFAGLIAFCFFGRVPLYVKAVAESSDECVVYLKAEDRENIEPGDSVDIEGTECFIRNISSQMRYVDDTFDDYVCSVGELKPGDPVYLVSVVGDVPRGIFEARIIAGYLNPMKILLGS